MGRAIEGGSLDLVRLLAERKANLRARVDGVSLMRFAADYDQVEIQSYLLHVLSPKSSKDVIP